VSERETVSIEEVELMKLAWKMAQRCGKSPLKNVVKTYAQLKTAILEEREEE
jgi:hypothetical protein